MDLMLSATAKAGGVYLYANQRGCDGGRLYFDGCASVVVNGQVIVQVGG
jgi:NAD+ synthase (glutamine-hydrolysing)